MQTVLELIFNMRFSNEPIYTWPTGQYQMKQNQGGLEKHMTPFGNYKNEIYSADCSLSSPSIIEHWKQPQPGHYHHRCLITCRADAVMRRRRSAMLRRLAIGG